MGVCLSAFALETMAALEGRKAGVVFRDLLWGCFLVSVHDRLQESVRFRAQDRRITCTCRKRLLVDLAALAVGSRGIQP